MFDYAVLLAMKGSLYLHLAYLCFLSRTPSACDSLEKDLLKEAVYDIEWITHHRRELHKIPELKYEEHATSRYIR